MALLKESALERLRQAMQSGRLAHAYLIEGPSGSGKHWLMRQLAAEILSSTPDEVESHPDFHSAAPESRSRRIVTEQVRQLEQMLQKKPLIGTTKVAVIDDADRLQVNAANAFLKTLEEPPAGSYIILLSSVPDAMLSTILSRCISVPLRSDAPPEELAAGRELAETVADALLTKGGANVASAMRCVRVFQRSISATKERITSELDAEFKAEWKQVKEMVDGKWKEDREDQIKARAESVIVRERQLLLDSVEHLFAAALRCHQLPSEPCSETARKLAEADGPVRLLKRLSALERTRDLLARGVQEGLALESGFLEMIAGS